MIDYMYKPTPKQTFEIQFMEKLSNTKAEVKKRF